MAKSKAGRIRRRLAALLSKQFGGDVPPEAIWQKNDPASRELDLPRWGVNLDLPGRADVYVHCWDRMADVLRFGLAIVRDEGTMIQVCADER